MKKIKMKVYQLKAELEQLMKDGYAHAEVVGPRKRTIDTADTNNFCSIGSLLPLVATRQDGYVISKTIHIEFKNEK